MDKGELTPGLRRAGTTSANRARHRPTVLFLSNLRQPPTPGCAAGEAPDPHLLTAGLIARGFRVRALQPHGFPINPLAELGTFYAGFDPVRAVRVLLFERHADVIVSVGESNIALILLLAPLLRFRPRIVLREISARGWRRRDRITDFVLPRVDRVMVLTPHQQAWAQANFRLRASPDLVGFAIDEGFYKPLHRQEEGYVLAVGDDVGRDYACLIAACRDTPYRLVLRNSVAIAIPAEMRDRVTILDHLSSVALREVYARASVVVVPLRPVDHPSGVTTLYEAMAMGCPVVASDVGSTRHAVRDGINGVLVAPSDPTAMRAALERLMQDEAMRRMLGVAARQTIEDEFSYAAYVNRFAASLNAAVAGARPSSAQLLA